ncbi:MAG: hypothetical protein ACJART_000167 [Maribacter sp.]|jgi:hypothetical protein
MADYPLVRFLFTNLVLITQLAVKEHVTGNNIKFI